MMKIAMPVWGNQVSTVLDFSEILLIVNVEDREINDEDHINWSLCNDTMKLSLLQEKGVAVLLCGAVSKPMQIMLEDSGINVISGLRGKKEEILMAYLDGTLHEDGFRLPGSPLIACQKKNRRCRNRR